MRKKQDNLLLENKNREPEAMISSWLLQLALIKKEIFLLSTKRDE